MQHDVLALTNLQDAIETLQYPVDPVLFDGCQWLLCLDDHGLAVQHCFDLHEVVGGERRAARNEIADQVRLAELGCDLHRA